MLYIKKQNQPDKFTQYAGSVNAHFDDMPSEVKSVLRKSLLEEQGYLCAYCMQRIAVDDVKIEHYVPRNLQNELRYSNLLAVCKGGEGRAKIHQTCDTHKGNTELHIDPQLVGDIETIYYTSNGYIKSSVADYQEDLDTVLNLNDEDGYLVYNRREVLKSFQHQLFKRAGNARINKEYFIKCLKRYSRLNDSGEYIPYVGIILWYLKKKINSL